MLKQHSTPDIYAGISHSVLTDLSIERLMDSDLMELISTNSVPSRLAPGNKIAALSVAGLIGEGIRRIHDDKSVSSLFEVKKSKSSTLWPSKLNSSPIRASKAVAIP